MKTILTALILMGLWLLMSGIYEFKMIMFGIASVLAVLVIVRRMDAVDGDGLDIRLNPFRFFGYLMWLLVEIAKANLAVTRLILMPKIRLRQHLFPVKFSQKSDLGRVIFANSITLTPGTISVESDDGHILVHAVDYSADDNLALAHMDARVSSVEPA